MRHAADFVIEPYPLISKKLYSPFLYPKVIGSRRRLASQAGGDGVTSACFSSANAPNGKLSLQ